MINCNETESFSNRYIVKILSSILIGLLNVIVQVLLPRAFSIEEYGYYSYNLNVFTSVVAVFNLSTSNALVAKFAKNNEDKGYVIFYLRYFAIISLILNVGILILFPTSFIHNSFGAQTLCIILLGLNATVVRKLLTDIVSVFDAMAYSRLSAFWQIIQKILITISVVFGYFLGILNLFVFYIMQIITIVFFAALLICAFSQLHKRKYNVTIKRINKEYLKEFFIFCKPLVLATFFSQIIIMAKNWALMHWGGVSSSALFGAAWQLNLIISFIFSPYAELMKREFSVIYEDKKMLRYRIMQSLKIMSWIVSFFCIFIVVFASDILMLLFGDKYENAVFVTQLIMIYTVYQAWGQILGSFMLALEYTKATSIMSMISIVFSLVLLYFLQFPNIIWQKGLGINGLAYSYVIGNLFSVTMTLGFVTKKLKIPFMKIYIVPIFVMLLCCCAALVSYTVVKTICLQKSFLLVFIRIIFGGFLYSSILFLLIWKFPNLLGNKKSFLLKNLDIWCGRYGKTE